MMNALVLLAALAATDSKPVVSVMYFDNATKNAELDVMRKGLADLLVTDLVAWDGVTVVERARLEEVLGELKLQQSKAFDAQTAVKVGKLMGAQYQLTGTMVMKGRELVVDAKLLKVQDGSVVVTTRATADQDKIFDLEQELAGKIINAIDAKLTANAVARRKAKVPDLETLLAYSKAIDLSDQGKLAEAQAAMQQVVSKAPTFLLARERREALLKAFQAYEVRKKDLVSDSALAIGKLVEEGLKDEAKLDSMDRAQAARFLALRLLKGRFILRSAKQFFSSGSHLRVALKGQEAKAVLAMRGWLENQRRFADEVERTQRRHAGLTRGELTADEQRMVADAKFGALDFHDPFVDSLHFVLYGRATDGEPVRLAPALGFVDPRERAAVLQALDKRVDAAFATAKADASKQWQVSTLVDERADASLQTLDVDAAVTVLQRYLDAFPTSSHAASFEERIKNYLSGRGIDGLDYTERWNKGLKGCDGMDLNVGSQSLDARMVRAGLAAATEMASEMEKACPRSPKIDSSFATIYSRFANTLAQHQDCEGFRGMFTKYIACGGSVRDMMGWQKRSGCSLGDLTKELSWFHSRRDRNWDAEFTDELASSLAGKTLTLSGKSWLGTPAGKKRQGLELRAEQQADGSFTCTSATSLRYDGVKTDGTCTIVITSLASGPGQFDEGTFSATFLEPWDGYTRKTELTEGVFKLKRK